MDVEISGCMLNVDKTLSIDVDIIRRKFFAACNCLLGNSIHENEILKLCLQESYALPVLQYACSAISFTKSQLNVCAEILCIDVFLVL